FANPNIYIMDIRNYTWVNSFEITSTNVTTKSEPSIPTASIIVANSNNSELGTMKIIIASLGGLLGLVIFIACGYLIYRWNEKRRNELKSNIGEHTLPGNIVEHNRSYIAAY
ncbi:16887_t:CDS:2, partial [Funneliformis mosseae]